MSEQVINSNLPKKDFRYILLIFQAAFASLIVCMVLVTRLIGGQAFEIVYEWYDTNMKTDTSLEDVFGSYSNYSDFDGDEYAIYSE